MPKISELTAILETFAPVELAEDWDNVGLLVGDEDTSVDRVMTCLTITPATVQEAIEGKAGLIVSHHPLPFQPLRAITSQTTSGRLLLELIAHRIAVYSPHTAFDSAQTGINQHLAIGLGLEEIQPLIPSSDTEPDVGAGRCGIAGEPLTLRDLAERSQSFLDTDRVQLVGYDEQEVARVAIACGSGGSFLEAAVKADCQALVTGEANFHACLEAEARGVGLVLAGHFASERFALLTLADYLSDQLAGVETWASRSERDPVRRL
ncbi:Nif3-like dinuclear metal center hexameric protein [Adhaeretor mobilis]|uniref:GTP cyclohydrolase 1 type 2 homolog n=1 Tax=Adhaeretor mobilis TaxID=1930276 RepID=A0A517MS83_9BACT|nr:Nif3-like dinuclear metal center hexameric protein [Adhaeretor mobilis]QDS97743.1 Putative GTP cyclohydrolase 1 type 2 [Adhaeretor mobilis]